MKLRKLHIDPELLDDVVYGFLIPLLSIILMTAASTVVR